MVESDSLKNETQLKGNQQTKKSEKNQCRNRVKDKIMLRKMQRGENHKK